MRSDAACSLSGSGRCVPRPRSSGGLAISLVFDQWGIARRPQFLSGMAKIGLHRGTKLRPRAAQRRGTIRSPGCACSRTGLTKCRFDRRDQYARGGSGKRSNCHNSDYFRSGWRSGRTAAVTNLARPGGNATGVTDLAADTAGNRLALLEGGRSRRVPDSGAVGPAQSNFADLHGTDADRCEITRHRYRTSRVSREGRCGCGF